MRTDILGHPPSLCNCRRVWHPCHTHAPYQGVQWSPLHQPTKNCTNQAATASSHRIHRTHRSLLLKCTPTEFTEFSCRGEFLCILRVPWDNTTQPKHLWASVPSVGGLFRAATRTHPGGAAVSAAPTKQELHQPSCHCILPQNSQNTQKPLVEMYSHRIHRIFLQRRTSVYSACSVGQYYAT